MDDQVKDKSTDPAPTIMASGKSVDPAITVKAADNTPLASVSTMPSGVGNVEPSPTILSQSSMSRTIGQTIYSGKSIDVESLRAAEAEVSKEWKVGDTVLDLYEVEQIFTSGGMGLVYKVHHNGWNIDLVVKSPRPEYFRTEEHKQSFIREAETWVNLGLHPHIVSCHYVRTLGDIPRVFAEYVDGGSLADWISTGKLYEGGKEKALERILDIAIQFAWGLHYAHEQGLVHQDVKPANVMMTSDGTAKVTDFGLVNTIGGTPAYLSPEQAESMEKKHSGVPFENIAKLTIATDIWSWGLSILEMFTGSVTWMAGQAAAEVLNQVEETGPDNPNIPKMPASILELLKQCFYFNPAKRPDNMLEIAALLQGEYLKLIRNEFPRKLSKLGQSTADNLNNRALSYFDIGKEKKAEECWVETLVVDPQHLETIYNRGILLWRRGKITGEALIQQLETVRTTNGDPWQAKYMLALVHMERGDIESAKILLNQGLEQSPNETELKQALKLIESEKIPSFGCAQVINGQSDKQFKGELVSCLGSDGGFAIAGNSVGNLQIYDIHTGESINSLKSRLSIWLQRAVSLSGMAIRYTIASLLGIYQLWLFFILLRSIDEIIFVDPLFGFLKLLFDITLLIGVFKLSHYLIQKPKNYEIKFVCLSSDEQFVLSGGEDNKVRLWSIAKRRSIRKFKSRVPIWLYKMIKAFRNVSIYMLLFFFSYIIFSIIKNISYRNENLSELVINISVFLFFSFIVFGIPILILGFFTNFLERLSSEGHFDTVSTGCFSADGRYILTGGKDKTMRLWDTKRGYHLKVFKHSDPVTAVCFSSDGLLAFSGSGDKKIRVWEVASGKLLHSFEGHSEAVSSLSLSKDGQIIVSGSQDNSIRLWQVATGDCLRVFEGSRKGITSVSISADNQFVLSGSGDNSLWLWKAATGRVLRIFEGHKDAVTTVSLNSKENFALSGSADGTLRVWKLSSSDDSYVSPWQLSRIRKSSEILNAENKVKELLKKGESALQNGDYYLAHNLINEARQIHGFQRMPESLESWAKLSLYCIRKGLRAAWPAKVYKGHTGGVKSVALSMDRRVAISGSIAKIVDEKTWRSWLNQESSKTLWLWEVDTGEPLLVFKYTESINTVCLNNDLTFAISGSKDNVIYKWNLTAGSWTDSFYGHQDCVNAVSLSTDSRFFLSGSSDSTLKLWDISTGQCLRNFTFHIFERFEKRMNYIIRQKKNSISFREPIGKTVTKISSIVFKDPTCSVLCACLSRDGRFAISGCDDNALHLFEVSTGRYIRRFNGHLEAILAIHLSTENRFVLSGSADNTMKLWEVATGRCLQTFEGHTAPVKSVFLSADWRFALSSSADTTLKLWEVDTARCLWTFEGHGKDVNSVCLSADGRYVLSGSDDNTLRLWELDWEIEAHNPSDWDNAASPLLETFLTIHTPYTAILSNEYKISKSGKTELFSNFGKPNLSGKEKKLSEKEIQPYLTRSGKPKWEETDFQKLIRQLQYAGYGWLRPEGVHKELEKMATEWNGSSPLLGERK